MTLWDKVQKTNPAFTKENKHGAGGGTSINTTYAFKCATEAFGPIGIGWGYEVLADEIIEGATVSFGAKESQQFITEKIHTLKIKFWYKLNGERGEFEQYGHTDYVGKNKYGPYTESEPQKKSLSDAIKKALSMLGFSADIYLGMYDDMNYVNSVIAETSAETAEEIIDREEAKAQEFRDWVEERKSIYDAAQSVNTVKTAHNKSLRVLNERFSRGLISQKQHDGAVIALEKHSKSVIEKGESGEATIQDK